MLEIEFLNKEDICKKTGLQENNANSNHHSAPFNIDKKFYKDIVLVLAKFDIKHVARKNF